MGYKACDNYLTNSLTKSGQRRGFLSQHVGEMNALAVFYPALISLNAFHFLHIVAAKTQGDSSTLLTKS